MACAESTSGCCPKEKFAEKIKGLDATDIIKASGRLIDLANILNLDDCNKILPFLSYPFVNDFEKLRAQTREVKKIYEGHSLDNPFDNHLFRKMQVIAHQMAPRANASVAYCELKSQLCLEKNDFFFEVYSRVEDKVRTCDSERKIVTLMGVVCRIRNFYDVYVGPLPKRGRANEAKIILLELSR